MDLQKIQSKLRAPKSQENKFGGYKYRSVEDIMEAVKPILAEEKCWLTLSDKIEQLGERFYLKATATISDGTATISTTAYAREPIAKKGMDDSQITGCASSYARKYALNGLLAIDDSKDADFFSVSDGEALGKKYGIDALDKALNKIGYDNITDVPKRAKDKLATEVKKNLNKERE